MGLLDWVNIIVCIVGILALFALLVLQIVIHRGCGR